MSERDGGSGRRVNEPGEGTTRGCLLYSVLCVVGLVLVSLAGMAFSTAPGVFLFGAASGAAPIGIFALWLLHTKDPESFRRYLGGRRAGD
jgi:hypothetical protein